MAEKFAVVKKGYDTTSVDQYIETMENVIKSYKEKDSAIKNAILNAQIAADSIIQNAKNHAKEIREQSLDQVADIKDSVSKQREMLNEFKEEYTNLMSKYFTNIDNKDVNSVGTKIDFLEKYLNKFIESPNNSNKTEGN